MPQHHTHTRSLPCVQVVSLHCLLDKSTHHLINKERLAMMKKDAVLINAARGPIVDEVALVDHLKANPEFRWVDAPRASKSLDVL